MESLHLSLFTVRVYSKYSKSNPKAMIYVRPKGLTFVETQCKNIHQVKLPYSVIKEENTVTVFFLFALIRAKHVYVMKTNPWIGLPRTWVFHYNFCWFHFHFHMWNKEFAKVVGEMGGIKFSQVDRAFFCISQINKYYSLFWGKEE